MNKERVIKEIDGKIYYEFDYVNFLYQELEKHKLILKALHKYYYEHEWYEDDEFLKQLENCTENDMIWLKRTAGEDDK